MVASKIKDTLSPLMLDQWFISAGIDYLPSGITPNLDDTFTDRSGDMITDRHEIIEAEIHSYIAEFKYKYYVIITNQELDLPKNKQFVGCLKELGSLQKCISALNYAT